MAKAKTKKVNTNTKVNLVKMPAGFKTIDNGTTIEWEHIQTVQGTVKGIKTMDSAFKKKETWRILEILTDDGVLVSVKESGGLRSLFDSVEIGDKVFIHATGEFKDTGKGNPMRCFQVGINKKSKNKSKK